MALAHANTRRCAHLSFVAWLSSNCASPASFKPPTSTTAAEEALRLPPVCQLRRRQRHHVLICPLPMAGAQVAGSAGGGAAWAAKGSMQCTMVQGKARRRITKRHWRRKHQKKIAAAAAGPAATVTVRHYFTSMCVVPTARAVPNILSKRVQSVHVRASEGAAAPRNGTGSTRALRLHQRGPGAAPERRTLAALRIVVGA
jgi:hypothetical protein